MKMNSDVGVHLYYPQQDNVIDERDRAAKALHEGSAARGFMVQPGMVAREAGVVNQKASEALTKINADVAQKVEGSYFDRETFDKNHELAELEMHNDGRKVELSKDKHLAETAYMTRQNETKGIERNISREKITLDKLEHGGRMDVLEQNIANIPLIAQQEADVRYDLTTAKDDARLEVDKTGDAAQFEIRKLDDLAGLDIQVDSDVAQQEIGKLRDSSSLEINKKEEDVRVSLLQSNDFSDMEVKRMQASYQNDSDREKADYDIDIDKMGEDARMEITRLRERLEMDLLKLRYALAQAEKAAQADYNVTERLARLKISLTTKAVTAEGQASVQEERESSKLEVNEANAHAKVDLLTAHGKIAESTAYRRVAEVTKVKGAQIESQKSIDSSNAEHLINIARIKADAAERIADIRNGVEKATRYINLYQD